MLIVGNMTKEKANEIGADVVKVLDFTKDNHDWSFNENRGCKLAKIQPGEVIEWDSKHQGKESNDSDEGSNDAEMGEDEIDEDMGDEESEEEEEEKGDSENNNCISMYFQSDKASLK